MGGGRTCILGVTGMAALKWRRTLLLLSLNMAVVPPYRPAFRFIDRDGLTDLGGAVGCNSRAKVRRWPECCLFGEETHSPIRENT